MLAVKVVISERAEGNTARLLRGRRDRRAKAWRRSSDHPAGAPPDTRLLVVVKLDRLPAHFDQLQHDEWRWRPLDSTKRRRLSIYQTAFGRLEMACSAGPPRPSAVVILMATDPAAAAHAEGRGDGGDAAAHARRARDGSSPEPASLSAESS